MIPIRNPIDLSHDLQMRHPIAFGSFGFPKTQVLVPALEQVDLTFLSEFFDGYVLVVYRDHQRPPILGGIKQCNCMVIFRDFPEKSCIVWFGNVMTPGLR